MSFEQFWSEVPKGMTKDKEDLKEALRAAYNKGFQNCSDGWYEARGEANQGDSPRDRSGGGSGPKVLKESGGGHAREKGAIPRGGGSKRRRY